MENFCENFQPQRTILKLLFISLNNSFLSNWRCGGESSSAATSKMELFVIILLSLITIVTTSFILHVAAALNLLLYTTILYNSLQVLQILNNLKLESAIFYQFLFLQQPIALWKLWKFHLKSSFCSQDIQIFLVPSSPLFLTVGHCFRGWSKVNLKVHNAINCLNKNLITDFVWYHPKEKRYDIET